MSEQVIWCIILAKPLGLILFTIATGLMPRQRRGSRRR